MMFIGVVWKEEHSEALPLPDHRRGSISKTCDNVCLYETIDPVELFEEGQPTVDIHKNIKNVVHFS